MPMDFEQKTKDKIKEALSKAKPRNNVVQLFKTQSIVGDGNQQISNDGGVSQTIQGNNNTQISSNVTVNSQRAIKIELPLPPNSIGANPALRTRIESLIKEIKDEQFKRLGSKYNWAAFNEILAKEFGLLPKNWKQIFTFDENLAPDIIGFLTVKLDNTIGGKVRKAKTTSSMHTKPQCFKYEKDYLEQLEWDNTFTKTERKMITGYTSRKDIPVAAFNQWVAYLGRKCDAMYGDD